jgi:arsenate reductase
MAEAMLTHWGGERSTACSAGSHPAGFVHPLAIAALGRLNVPLHDARSKSWNEFAESRLDAVITLCDAAASESCPVWPGAPISAHWSLPDPAFHPGSVPERVEFAVLVAQRLAAKVRGLVEIDWSKPREHVEERLRFLGEI